MTEDKREFIRVNSHTEFPLDVLRQAGVRWERVPMRALKRAGAVDWYLVWPNGEVVIGWDQLNQVFRAIGHEQEPDAPHFQEPTRNATAS